jgi:transposase-like protein
MARPSKYPPEFRVRAVALVLESGRPIKHVADELGLGSESLRQWVRQHEADQGLRTDRPTSTETPGAAPAAQGEQRTEAHQRHSEVGERVFRPGARPDPAKVVSFVQQHKQAFGVEPLLAVLGEPVSTFYDRAGHRPSARALSDAALLERIEAIWEASRQTYGSPRVHAMLLRQGHAVGANRVAHLMAKAGIEGAHLRKHWKTTRQDARNTAAPDLVDRNFTAQAPNRLWVADFSYFLTMQGVLYLATVLDVFSRKIVGWQMSDRMTTDLVLSAFEMALWRRDVVRQQLVHHSDKGSTPP